MERIYKKNVILSLHICILTQQKTEYINTTCVWPDLLGLQNTPTASPQRSKTPPNESPGYDTKQSDREASVILELWGMLSSSSLPSLPGPLWPGGVAPDRVLSIGQIERNHALILNWIVWHRTIFSFKRAHTKTVLNLNWIVWNGSVWSFNCVWTNDWCLIEFLVIHSNNWNY